MARFGPWIAVGLASALLITLVAWVVIDAGTPVRAQVAASGDAKALVPVGLEVGKRLRLALPKADPDQSTTLQLLVATYVTSPEVVVRTCAALDCVTTRARPTDNDWLDVKLPDAFESGALDVSLDQIHGGALGLWTHGGEPRWRLTRTVTWRHFTARFAEHARIVGAGHLLVALLLAAGSGLVLLALCARELVRRPPERD